MPTGYDSENSFPFDDRGAEFDIESDDALWDLLSLYIDGEATPDQAATVEGLLRTDPAYARSYAMLTMASDTVRHTPDVEPPVGLRESILAKTSHRESRLSRVLAAFESFREGLTVRTNWSSWMAPAGGLAAAGLAGMLLWSHMGPVPGVAVTRIHGHGGHPASIAKASHKHSSTQSEFVTNSGTPNKIHKSVGAHIENPMTPSVDSERASDRRNSGLTLAGLVTGSGNKRPHRTSVNVVSSNGVTTEVRSLAGPAVDHYDPKMDENVKHPLVASNSDTKTDLGPAVDTDDTAATTKAPDVDTAVHTAVADKVAMVSTPKPIVHYAALPPEARQVIDGATLKRNKEAQLGGYDRDTAESIERHEVTLSVIKSSF